MANTLTLVHDMWAEMEGELNDQDERTPNFGQRPGYVCLGKKGRKEGRKKRTKRNETERNESSM